MSFVKVCTVYNSYEADFLKEDLESEGIPCILTNVHMTNLYPNMEGLPGFGIQVLVPKDEVSVAEKIVNKRSIIRAMTSCPDCGSSNVDLLEGPGMTARLSTIVAAIFAFTPLANIRHAYHCNSCKSEFKR